MALKWSTTDQVSATQGVKVLVHSDSGIGKTTLCATCPNPVILSAEAGLLSLRKWKIPTIQITNINDLMEAYTWLTGSQEANQFGTVCLDSITEIAEVVLANAKGLVKDPRQAYGEMIEKMSMVIRSFRDLPGKNVYMSSKQEYVKDEAGIAKYAPAMPGNKLGPQIPYFFDEVFALRVGRSAQGQLYRYIQTQPDLQYVAKDRSGALDAMEPPDLGAIFNKIQTS
jgi:hypothetical protein